MVKPDCCASKTRIRTREAGRLLGTVCIADRKIAEEIWT